MCGGAKRKNLVQKRNAMMKRRREENRLNTDSLCLKLTFSSTIQTPLARKIGGKVSLAVVLVERVKRGIIHLGNLFSRNFNVSFIKLQEQICL